MYEDIVQLFDEIKLLKFAPSLHVVARVEALETKVKSALNLANNPLATIPTQEVEVIGDIKKKARQFANTKKAPLVPLEPMTYTPKVEIKTTVSKIKTEEEHITHTVTHGGR